MLPPLTDLVALLGLNLVLCAVCLRLLGSWLGVGPWAKWAAAFCFVLLWIPLGAAHLPLVAYVRGISSDPSITLVVLACLALFQRLFGLFAIDRRERMALLSVVAAASLFLYPLALGWGDWDPYRLGWGSPVLWGSLLLVSLFFMLMGLGLLPLVVALALLAWTAGILESSNLWDYLMDPWLALVAIFQCASAGIQVSIRRLCPAKLGATVPDV
jgi:hypothetical protein